MANDYRPQKQAPGAWTNLYSTHLRHQGKVQSPGANRLGLWRLNPGPDTCVVWGSLPPSCMASGRSLPVLKISSQTDSRASSWPDTGSREASSGWLDNGTHTGTLTRGSGAVRKSEPPRSHRRAWRESFQNLFFLSEQDYVYLKTVRKKRPLI